jgi:hypothetical protein
MDVRSALPRRFGNRALGEGSDSVTLRNELYEWHLRLANAFSDLTPEELEALQLWRDGGDFRPDWAWPGWIQIIGERPRYQPRLVAFPSERSA